MENSNPNDVIPLKKAVFIILAIILPVVIFVIVGMLMLFTDLFTRTPPAAEALIADGYDDEDGQNLDIYNLEGIFAIEAGEVVTVAGTGQHGSADGALAEFNMPASVAVGGGNLIIVADTYNNVLRQIGMDGSVGTMAGAVHYAGRERFPIGLYIDGAAEEAGFYRPSGIAILLNSRVFIADSYNHAVRVMVNGQVYTISGAHGQGHADGYPAESMFDTPTALAVGPGGYLYVADTGNHVIRRISPTGHVTTIAGVPQQSGYANGAAPQALFYSPMGITVAPDGRVFVADTGNHLIRVISDGVVSTLAGSRVLLDADEHDGHADGWDDAPVGEFEDGYGAQARFNRPMGIDLWDGSLVVADSSSHSIRLVNITTGGVTTLAGSGYPHYMSGSVDVAEFHFPSDVYVFSDFLFIADSGNNKIRLMRLG